MPGEVEQSSDGVRVNRAKLGSISVYEITEDELDLLERGSPNSTYFNFAIALLSISISFLISVFSTTIESIKVYAVFWIVALVTLILGSVLLLVWWRASKGIKSIFKRIRERMAPTNSIIEAETEQEIPETEGQTEK